MNYLGIQKWILLLPSYNKSARFWYQILYYPAVIFECYHEHNNFIIKQNQMILFNLISSRWLRLVNVSSKSTGSFY